MKNRIIALCIAAAMFLPLISQAALITENNGYGTQLPFRSIILPSTGSAVTAMSDAQQGTFYRITGSSSYVRSDIEFSKDQSIEYHKGDYLYVSFYWRAPTEPSPAKYLSIWEGFEFWDMSLISLGNAESSSMNYGEWNKVEMVLPHGEDRTWNNVRLRTQFGASESAEYCIDFANLVCYYLGAVEGTQSEALDEFRRTHKMTTTPDYQQLDFLEIRRSGGEGRCEKVADYSYGSHYRLVSEGGTYFRANVSFAKEMDLLYAAGDYFYLSFYWRAQSSVSPATYLNRAEKMEKWDGNVLVSIAGINQSNMNYDKWNKAEFIVQNEQDRTWNDIRLQLQFGGADTTQRILDIARPVCYYIGAVENANVDSIMAEFKSEELSASQVDMLTLPKTGVFETGGAYHNKNGYSKWLNEGTPETLVEKLLTGNYAFVENSNYYWNNTGRGVLAAAPCRNADNVLQIPAQTANELFGTSFDSDFVSAAEISEASQWETFVDPRGFMLVSHDIESYIDVAPASDSDRQYRSYYDVSLAIGHITWEDISPTAEDWAAARSRYLQALTFCEGKESECETHITQTMAAAQSYLEKLDSSQSTTLPFTGTSLTNCMGYTRNIARAYYMLKITGRSDLDKDTLRDAAIMALDKLFTNYIGRNVSLDTNWFLNLITDPGMLTQAMAYLYDELAPDTMDKYANILYLRTGVPMVTTYYVPFKYTTYSGYSGDLTNAYCNYSNLVWRTSVIYQLSLLTENTARINHCLKYFNQVFENVTNSGKSSVKMLKNGVYEDGSFVFHGNFAYNLGYGNSYITNLAELVWIGSGTAMDIKKVYGFENIYGWMEKSFIPFIYQNTLMKIVQGRENPYGSGASANSAVKAMMILASEGGENRKEEIAVLLKPLVEEHYSSYKNATSASTFGIFYYPALNAATDDCLEYIKAASEAVLPQYNYAYYNMDRFAHKRQDYTFMLAMSSERIDKYEAINDNGYSDWYTGDGMTYVLKDEAQYIQRWWQYVDKYAIPGTTVDSAQRQVRSVTYGNEILPNNSWAGGVSDGNIGVAGMIYPSEASYKTSYVDARKSYFMLDDKIVCLGSGISGGEGDVYTTVENYISYEKENEDSTQCGYVDAYVDTVEQDYSFDVKRTHENPQYVWLESNRGYVFLGENTVSTERVKDSKRFCGNSAQTSNPGEFPFYTIKIEHGENPSGATYGYVLLPHKTRAETAAFAENIDFEVLVQTDNCHAIRLADGTVMANVFEPNTELCGFEFADPISVIIRKADTGYRLHIAEPTQQKSTVEFTAPRKTASAEAIVTAGGSISVEVDENYGKTYAVELFETAIAAFDGEELTISSSENQTVMIVYASYTEDRLKNIGSKKISLEEGINIVDMSDAVFDGDRLSILLLRSWETLEPLCAAYSR
ncbi:MAG: polysaccharide lyase family 8 super-sandwich domain-containing protein [Clostridia bacterium]|nr:polysaccharide lyase family 8 super-sandwich domain-containing protein [Clostridia bacterium]